MNAEPPVARFHMEPQPRRPGYAQRCPAKFVHEIATHTIQP